VNANSTHLTYSEAAQFLGVPVGTLYSMACRRQLPHVRLGKRIVRFPRHELEAWVAKCHVEAVESSRK
jgi:excisionase family DNA binding protein